MLSIENMHITRFLQGFKIVATFVSVAGLKSPMMISGETFLSDLANQLTLLELRLEMCEQQMSQSNNIANNRSDMQRKNAQEIAQMKLVIAGLVNDSQVAASDWLEDVSSSNIKYLNAAMEATFNYRTNMTKENLEMKTQRNREWTQYMNTVRHLAQKRLRPYLDDDTNRQLQKYSFPSSLPKDDSKLTRLNEISNNISTAYATAKVCRPSGGCLSLNPGLTNLLARSNNLKELKWAWGEWRNAIGPTIRDNYIELVKLRNEGATDNGFTDRGQYMRLAYEQEDIDTVASELFAEIKALYKELYAFVRRRLIEKYGEVSGLTRRGPIPAHLLGNMWAQTWANLIGKRIAAPYSDISDNDITSELIRQNYTVMGLFRKAEEFFVSIGLYNMTDTFWEKSMLVKPSDLNRQVNCHASAYDMYSKGDFRIKMCTDITHESFATVHHEMGHIEYDMAYQNQPVIFRRGANPSFHEALGDVITLSVNTPSHLKAVGLMKETNLTDELKHQQDINFLMAQALRIVAFYPFAYLMDSWRWKVFDGTIQPSEYNRKWWEMRLEYQGLIPPFNRTNTDFDPGCKYHIAFGVPYVRYFFSYIAMFQFYEAMCKDIHNGPLHTCDFYNSKTAGTKLRSMMELGSSKPWPEAMKTITGQTKISTKPLLRYFRPLRKWLRKQNGNDKGDWLKPGETTQSVISSFFN